MQQRWAWMEIYRWGYANIPGILFNYARELEIEIEDIGVLAVIFYTFEKSKPLFQTGITAGQILQNCPFLTKQKLSRKLNRLTRLEIITTKNNNKSFGDKEIYLDPLLEKLEFYIVRDHSEFSQLKARNSDTNTESLVEELRSKVEQLQLELEEEKNKHIAADPLYLSDNNYKRVADFISRKTGNLMSAKMANELKIWLEELAFTPEFLLCMLELSFERNIYNPRDISKIARDIKEYSITNVEGLEMYFNKFVDTGKNKAWRFRQFDPDIVEFGTFTGIDMNAEARKKNYYKWRFDWNFSHKMIMKAGEVMCQHTKNGGLEYIDSVLHDWMSKEIRQVEEAEKEIRNFKLRNKSQKSKNIGPKQHFSKNDTIEEYEIFIPPYKLDKVNSEV